MVTQELDYQFVEGWAKLPPNWSFKQVAGVIVDSKDRVYAFNRGEHPIIVFDKNGYFIRSWGEGIFKNAHGSYIDSNDNVFCVDNVDHTVRKYNQHGDLLLTIGSVDRPNNEGGPFNKPTDLALGENGDIYVTDGYGASRVHRFTSNGELIQSWGKPGTGPGEFNLPHGVWVYKRRVYVADRQNFRVQIFSTEGEYVAEWRGLERPCDVYVDKQGRFYVAELHSRVTILNDKGEVIKRLGGTKSFTPGEFVAPHCVWTDSEGSLYVGEVLEGQRLQKFKVKQSHRV